MTKEQIAQFMEEVSNTVSKKYGDNVDYLRQTIQLEISNKIGILASSDDEKADITKLADEHYCHGDSSTDFSK